MVGKLNCICCCWCLACSVVMEGNRILLVAVIGEGKENGKGDVLVILLLLFILLILGLLTSKAKLFFGLNITSSSSYCG